MWSWKLQNLFQTVSVSNQPKKGKKFFANNNISCGLPSCSKAQDRHKRPPPQPFPFQTHLQTLATCQNSYRVHSILFFQDFFSLFVSIQVYSKQTHYVSHKYTSIAAIEMWFWKLQTLRNSVDVKQIKNIEKIFAHNNISYGFPSCSKAQDRHKVTRLPLSDTHINIGNTNFSPTCCINFMLSYVPVVILTPTLTSIKKNSIFPIAQSVRAPVSSTQCALVQLPQLLEKVFGLADCQDVSKCRTQKWIYTVHHIQRAMKFKSGGNNE